MTFRGSFERDLHDFAQRDPDFQRSRGGRRRRCDRNHPERALLPQARDVLLARQAGALVRCARADAGLRLQCARQEAAAHEGSSCVGDTVDSIAARFNLRYNEQKWLNATAQLVADDASALQRFVARRYDAVRLPAVQPAGRLARAGPVPRARRTSSRRCGNQLLVRTVHLSLRKR